MSKKPTQTRSIFCCQCGGDVVARLTNQMEVYGHSGYGKRDFWICDSCENYVGCHPSTVEPLGVIATAEVRLARKEIHSKLDRLWQNGRATRPRVYAMLSEEIGKPYHTAEVTSVEEAKRVLEAVKKISKRLHEAQINK